MGDHSPSPVAPGPLSNIVATLWVSRHVSLTFLSVNQTAVIESNKVSSVDAWPKSCLIAQAERHHYSCMNFDVQLAPCNLDPPSVVHCMVLKGSFSLTSSSDTYVPHSH